MAKRLNGEGTIRENKARGRWEARLTVGVTETGAPIRKMVTGRTASEVTARMRELRDNYEGGQEPARRDLTVARFLEQWLVDVLPGTVAATTEQQYRDVIRLYVRPHLGRKRLGTLNARDVARMLRNLENEGLSPNTRRLARSVLRRALRWAEREGLVRLNAASLADGVRLGTAEGRGLTSEEARSFLASIRGDRHEAAFTVALSLGLRRGELLGLTWSDVSLDAAHPKLTVRRSLKRLASGLVLEETKTRQSRRTVHLPAQAVDALRSHRKRQAEERLKAGDLWEPKPLGADLIFRTPRGTAVDPDNFRQHCYRVTEAAGLGRWSPHELRHSAASLLLAQGVPLKTVSETLGHSSIRVTADVYGHLEDTARAAAADAMTRALGGAS
jgi:integrase